MLNQNRQRFQRCGRGRRQTIMGKAIIEQRARVTPQGAAGGAVENGDDQTDSITIHLADEATPSFEREAGFAAKRSLVGAQQPIMVDHRHHAPITVWALARLDPQGRVASAHDVSEQRIIHRLAENQRQIVSSRIMVIVWQTVRIHEMAVARTDLGSLGVHQFSESVNRAPRRLGQGFGGVVARFQH